MQPNQQNQDQNQFPQPAAMPYQVPDYLGLAPLATPKATRHIARKLIISIVVLILVIVAGVYAYQSWQYGQPQAVLYRALENNLRVQYVTRHFDIQTSAASGVVDDETDFSSPNSPKSSLSVSSSSDGGDVKIDKDVKMLSNIGYIFSIRSITPATGLGGLTKGQWYNQPSNSTGSVDYYMDEVDPLPALNMAQGTIVMGNFDDKQRSDLMTYIKANDTYHVDSIADSADRKTYMFTLEIDETKLNNLNTEAAKVLGVDKSLTIHTSHAKYQEMVLWVTKETSMITKMTYASGDDKNSLTTKKTVTYEYPKTMSIAKPNDIKELP